jgi:hypothetical protein
MHFSFKMMFAGCQSNISFAISVLRRFVLLAVTALPDMNFGAAWFIGCEVV